MLANKDLTQIRKIMREETEAESENLKTELLSEMKMSRMRIQNELAKLDTRLKNLEISNRKIQKDLKLTISFLDKENIKAVK